MKSLGGTHQELQALSDSLERRNEMKKAIRILLVGDHELLRRGLRHMLEPEKDFEVVGDCATADEALSEIQRLHPDIVLMDIQMPRVNGIEATRSLKRNGLNYDGDVIMVGESVDYRVEALKAGAASYLLRDITCGELTQAIREIYRGNQLSKDHGDFIEEAVELVVPPPANAARLLRFMCQLEEGLHDNYNNYASIIHTVGSWDRGTVITISLKPATFSSFLDKLGSMPNVEKVEEEPVARGAFSSFPKKFGILQRSRISPSKRVRITLKETSMARQELVAVLN